jgi:predicted transposase YdaD
MGINTEAVLIGPERRQADLDPWLTLLTLPVRPEAELRASTQQILDLSCFPHSPPLHREELMVFAGIPTDQLLHTRAAQDLLDRGRQEGEAQGEARGRALGEASVTLRLLNRICGPLSDATTARIQALPLNQLESLAEALLDFSGPADLAAWLADHPS